MSFDSSSDDPRGGSSRFRCDWRPEAVDAASVLVSGELDSATAPLLEKVLDEALREARVVLLNLQGMRFVDGAGLHVIVDASVRARETGGRLLVVGASPQTDARFTLTEARDLVEFLRTQIPAPAAPIRSDADVEPRIRPLDNPVNARVLDARVMAMPTSGLWLHGADGTLYRPWAPQRSVATGTPVEIYLDGRDEVNGWREPRSGLAINQRHRDHAAASPPAGTAVRCRGACGVVWLSPAPAKLIEHDERCLTCAGPLAVD